MTWWLALVALLALWAVYAVWVLLRGGGWDKPAGTVETPGPVDPALRWAATVDSGAAGVHRLSPDPRVFDLAISRRPARTWQGYMPLRPEHVPARAVDGQVVAVLDTHRRPALPADVRRHRAGAR